MSTVQLARQPIFDRELAVIGYELLFRDERSDVAPSDLGHFATPTVVLNSFTELGLDQVVGTREAWINVSREFLLGDMVRMLPADRVMLEILEGQQIDRSVIEAVTELRQEGYRFALDDFELATGADALIPLVDVIKLDMLALGRDGLADHVERLRGSGVELLAEKVETHEEHAFAKSLGCTRFQGFFYQRPELLSSRRIEAGRGSLMKLLSELQRPDVELGPLADEIGHDVGLSVRLLRYINSAGLGLGHEVTSVAQAVRLLGPQALRRWAVLSAFVGLGSDQAELTRTALGRARFCELVPDDSDAGQRFTVGLFSVIDVLTGMEMEQALESVPFPDHMRDALIDRSGAMGRPLLAVIAMEEAAFDEAERLCPGAAALYVQAIGWADAVTAELADLAPVAV